MLVAWSCLILCYPMDDPIGAHQAPLFMEFFRQQYWSGVPFSSPGDLPGPGTEAASPSSPAMLSIVVTTSATWEAHNYM